MLKNKKYSLELLKSNIWWAGTVEGTLCYDNRPMGTMETMGNLWHCCV